MKNIISENIPRGAAGALTKEAAALLVAKEVIVWQGVGVGAEGVSEGEA